MHANSRSTLRNALGRGKFALALVVLMIATACRSGAEPGQAPQGGGGPAAPVQERNGVRFAEGVTAEPCPGSPNPDRGCIYLGSLSDLTEGPFAALGTAITEAQGAFWQKVNESGGIAGQFDVEVATYVRDNKYNPQVTNQVYQEIKPNVLALAQTLGSPPTAAILEDLKASNVVAAPATWSSLWEFEDVILESGTNYCFEAANAVDYGATDLGARSAMAVHYPGEYGEDGAAGVQFAAQANGMQFTDVETPQGQENQTGAVSQIVQANPDIVFLTTGPTDAGTIVGQATAQGYQGQFMGQSPTWSPTLLDSPSAQALQDQFLLAAPWKTFTSSGPGYEAMRQALGDVEATDGYTSGWVWSYPMRAALEAAVANRDLTRPGLVTALEGLQEVDYEGMLPAGAGKFSGEPNEAVFRQSVISRPDMASPTGLTTDRDFFAGQTAQNYQLQAPCFEAAAG